jgi:hypothetical protein
VLVSQRLEALRFVALRYDRERKRESERASERASERERES